MKSCVSDTELSYKKLGSTLEGMCALFVDDTIHEGSKGYQTLTKKTGERFMWKEREWDKLKFAGQQIEQHDDMFSIHQKNYILKLQKLTYKWTWADFRSLQVKLSWTKNPRTDTLFSVVKLAQVTKDMFTK